MKIYLNISFFISYTIHYLGNVLFQLYYCVLYLVLSIVNHFVAKPENIADCRGTTHTIVGGFYKIKGIVKSTLPLVIMFFSR